MRNIYCILTFCLLISCGSRKAELDSQKAKTERLTELVLKLQNDIQSNVNVRKVAKKRIIESKDPSKPSTFNGQEFQNAKITEEETTSDSTATLNDKSKKEIKAKDEESSSEKNKIKNTKSKKPNPWLWLMIAIVLVAIIYFKPWNHIKSKK